MAALSALPTPGESGPVWQKVAKALSSANPTAQAAFKALRDYLVNQKGNPDLNFKAFSAGDLLTADDGVGVGAGTATLYGIYIRKRDDVTDAWFTVVDNGTDDNIYGGALTASYRQVLPGLGPTAAGVSPATPDDQVWVSGVGFAYANGIRLASFTAGAAGTTASAAAADSFDGFIVYGA